MFHLVDHSGQTLDLKACESIPDITTLASSMKYELWGSHLDTQSAGYTCLGSLAVATLHNIYNLLDLTKLTMLVHFSN